MKLTEDRLHQLEHERALAKATFPLEWEQSLAMTGDKRRARQKALRAKAVEKTAVARIREFGGSCGNCEHLLSNPAGLQGLFCDLDSDADGYARTDTTRCCSSWSRALEGQP